MKIVIIGDGKIGRTLAEQLSREGHDITIVDRSADALRQTSQDLDILCVEGNGATYAVQKEAGVDRADLLIAVTESDELNLLCCLLAKKIGARHTIARVRNPEYDGEFSLISNDLGLSLSVNPELTCATEIARSLRIPSAIKVDTFADGRVELLEFLLTEDSPLCGKTLMELPQFVKARVLICAVRRGSRDVYIPDGGFRLEAGDRVSMVASMRGANAFFRQLHLDSSPIRRVMLVGGGRIAYYLARQLLEYGMQVKIMDADMSHCEELSELLPKAEVLCGIVSESSLRENGLSEMDAFAALSGLDEENILLSMYVRNTYPNIKTITKVDRSSFKDLVATMDVGSLYNPRLSVANQICRYVRAMGDTDSSKIETLYKLVGGRVEALEFRVSDSSAVCGIPLMKLKLRKNLLIGCINRDGKVIIPSGQDTIEAGDTVVVVTTVTGLGDLDDILADRRG